MPARRLLLGLGVVLVCASVFALVALRLRDQQNWSEAERATLRTLWIGSLPPLPADPTNAVADDPRAAAFGQRLFFDTRFSANGRVACATCHLPALGFQDGKPLAQGIGTTTRRTMPIAGTAYSPWFFWDGRTDSQWAQALKPLENPVEHGGNRLQYAHLVAEHYRRDYEALFGPLPDLSDARRFPPSAGPVADPGARAAWEAMRPEDREAVTRIFANLGKAIAAYERRILPGPTRFDAYVAALQANDQSAMRQALSTTEVAGLRLFIGKAQCINCHNGPLLTNNAFHNTGVPPGFGLPPDHGRARGAAEVRADEFNCLSSYADPHEDGCAELRFLVTNAGRLERSFKPPSLRGVADRAPYMHAGQFATLAEVLRHYNAAPLAPAGHSELRPLALSANELAQLEAFLRVLSAPLATPPELLRPPDP